MKFSFKLLLWTMVLLAAALGLSGFYFVNYVFVTSLEREVGQALDENSILRFAFETAALNVPTKYGILQDSTVEEIAPNLERGGRDSGRLIRISDEERNALYARTMNCLTKRTKAQKLTGLSSGTGTITCRQG